MDKLPKISIVIACYNDPDVVKAVESAHSQTYKNKEIIVVDDGSKPSIYGLISTLENDIDFLLVQKNQGQSIARNNGIKKSTGEFILNLDSDDYFESSFCEKAIESFENDNEIKIVTCKARRFSTKGTIDVFTPRGGKLTDFLFSNSALGSAMFKKDDWRETGGYEEKLPILGFEDWEFYIQLLKNGGRAHVIPEVLFNYQVRMGSITQRIKKMRNEKYKMIILKHKELYRDNFERLMDDLFKKMTHCENELERMENKIDHRIGKHLLKPLRVIKKIFIR